MFVSRRGKIISEWSNKPENVSEGGGGAADLTGVNL